MWFRFEIVLLLLLGAVAFSERLESSTVSENEKGIRGFIKKVDDSLFNRNKEGLSGRTASNYDETRVNADNSRPGFGVDEKRSGSPTRNEDSFSSRPNQGSFTNQQSLREPNQGSYTNQQSLGKPNEFEGSTIEPSQMNRDTIWNISDHAFPPQVGENQQQQFRPGTQLEKQNTSFTSSNDRNPLPSNSNFGSNQSHGRPSGGSFGGQSVHQNQGGNTPTINRPSGESFGGQSVHQNQGGNTPTINRPSGGSFGGQSVNQQGGNTHTTSRPNGGSFNNQPPHHQGGNTATSTSGKPNRGDGNNSNTITRPNNENHANVTIEESVHESADEEEKEVCFPVLGCFAMGKPWKSALRPVGKPFGPDKIQTTLHFFSRDHSKTQKNITLHPKIDMGQAKFDPQKITAILVHGFSNSGNATWLKSMKDAYLKQVDANVMIVDWGKGAQHLNYFQVAGNTRVVGKQLATFVEHLKKNYGADTKKFHLIGHSLGAQICSYLAKDVPGIARLTAMDPAQPAFEGFDPRVRLDKSDADFVDVIHTDAKPFFPTFGFGMMAPHGHVDFYVNGGFDQPGCVPLPKEEIPKINSLLDLAKFPVEAIAKTIACPHGRSYQILTEAFNEVDKCIFWGHKADATNVFKSVTNTLSQGLFKKLLALSPTCTKEDCIPLGFATRKSPLRGSFVITTNAKAPFCISEEGVPPEGAPSREGASNSNYNNTNSNTGGNKSQRSG